MQNSSLKNTFTKPTISPFSNIYKERIKRLLKVYSETKDKRILEILVLHFLSLVRFLATKFAHRGEPLEDLIQVGSIGLLKALNNYDPKKNIEFITYATPTIIGEIKRYFRDKVNSIKVPRKLQELNYNIYKFINNFIAKNGRTPHLNEIAKALNIEKNEVVKALNLSNIYSTISIDSQLKSKEEDNSANISDIIGSTDNDIENIENKVSLANAISKLSPLEQKVIYLKFFKGLSQTEIAKKLGILQMKVSRIQNSALSKLKQLLN